MPPTPDFWGYVQQQGPLIFTLVLILVGGARRIWVWGWQYDQLVAERDTYRQLADRAGHANEQALALLQNALQTGAAATTGAKG